MSLDLAAQEELCFSYGSNMCTAYLHETCPGARPLIRATLPNYHIEFRRFSSDLNGGISTIIAAPGDRVEGVLCAMPRTELDALDILEDVDKGLYIRERFLVLGADAAWHSANVYRVAEPTGPFAPAKQYLDWMLRGATEHALPDDYIARIRGFAAS